MRAHSCGDHCGLYLYLIIHQLRCNSNSFVQNAGIKVFDVKVCKIKRK
nr:MAG TPA: hypothetical protein [Bacteriophage sp.]